MARPERPLDPSTGPIPAFAYSLRMLRRQAGNPTYRMLARKALFSPSVLSSAADGRREAMRYMWVPLSGRLE
jgi:hypothetical protein